jgi:hypothetical protein
MESLFADDVIKAGGEVGKRANRSVIVGIARVRPKDPGEEMEQVDEAPDDAEGAER